MRLGVVVAAVGEKAKVSMLAQDGCESCSTQGSCALGTRAQAPGERLTVRNGLGALQGDTVEVDLPQGAELQLNLAVWGLPLVGLIGGAVAGAWLAGEVAVAQDGGVLLGAACGFLLSFFALKRFDRLATRGSRMLPEIVRVRRG